jgi:Acyl-protein synthetase, LuxE
MMNPRGHDIEKELFNVKNAAFETLALEVFVYQYNENETYRQFCNALHIVAQDVATIEQIPFLPIQFFKSRNICTTVFEPEIIFESSGTTGSINSRHGIKRLVLYEESFQKNFQLFYGDVTGWCIVGLLPSYLQKGNSSLVYMINELIKKSGSAESGFYLYDYEKLNQTLLKNEAAGKPTLLIGVTYALLDFAEIFRMNLKHTVVMETGGMKGRREEMTREQVHLQLKNRLGLQEIHSEYGMTELLSQAYSSGNGFFKSPPWMRLFIRAEDDPFNVRSSRTITGQMATGVINIIDLANLYSCSFIATDDVGKLYADETFEVLGRLDNSDIRGCGLMLL